MAGFLIPVPTGIGRATVGLSVSLLSALAWLVLWVTDTSASGLWHLGHGFLHGSPGVMAALFITGWVVMTVAMMLPTTLPILTTLDRLARARHDRALLLSLAVTGYIAIWTAFGGLVYLAVLALHRWATTSGWGGTPGPAAAWLLLLAGSFQFSSLKYRCLEKCRSPLSVVLSYWQGHRERWNAFRLGAGHGLSCVGCCWALMLLMFAVGAAHLAWMLVLAVLMAVEKNMPWGRRVSAPLGLVLLAGAVAVWTVG